MQIYSKSMKNATSPLFRNHNRSALLAGTYITHRVIYYPLVIIIIIIIIKLAAVFLKLEIRLHAHHQVGRNTQSEVIFMLIWLPRVRN